MKADKKASVTCIRTTYKFTNAILKSKNLFEGDDQGQGHQM